MRVEPVRPVSGTYVTTTFDPETETATRPAFTLKFASRKSAKERSTKGGGVGGEGRATGAFRIGEHAASMATAKRATPRKQRSGRCVIARSYRYARSNGAMPYSKTREDILANYSASRRTRHARARRWISRGCWSATMTSASAHHNAHSMNSVQMRATMAYEPRQT